MNSLANTADEAIQTWRNNPVEFCLDVLGTRLWSKQQDIINSVRDNRYTVVRSGHGVGKTHVAANIVIWFLTVFHPSKVITTAPTWNQVKNILWTEVNKLYKKSNYTLGGEVMQTMVRYSDDHFAVGFSTDEADKFQGHHSDNVLVIFDEAPGVGADIWEASNGLLTNENCRFLAIGNPTKPSGLFYDAFKSPRYSKIRISCYDSPNVTSGKLLYPGLVTSEWIESMKQEYGENSPIFKARVVGDFPVEGEDTLIPLTWVENAMKRVAKPQTSEKYLGVDVARYGGDHTVFTGISDDLVFYVDGYQGKSTSRTVGEIVKLHREHSFEHIGVDDSGVGGGVTDQLEELGLPVVAVNFGSAAKENERFENLKAEIFWNLRVDLEQGRLSLPNHAKLLDELPSILYEVSGKGKLRIVSKDKMKAMGISSPDYADSLAIAHYTQYHGSDSILDFYKGEVTNEPSSKSFIASFQANNR